ncbi:MAG: hypothetical protein GY894_07415 [Planctomycetes bacterium]|nr:hypothetical protein [Planctomycetota bacterium]MCP4839173.1 hypothetical protein [Planctomycetota bacterium]
MNEKLHHALWSNGNGVPAPAGWIGGGMCDEGTYLWNGMSIYCNCEAFGCDGGNCTCLP